MERLWTTHATPAPPEGDPRCTQSSASSALCVSLHGLSITHTRLRSSCGLFRPLPHLRRAGEGAPRPARWQVEDTLEKTQLHEDLLEAGLLNIVNAWLRPLADGSIPNVSVRTTLLRLLTKLPVNVEMFDRREQLKKSGLGKVGALPLFLVSASFRVLGG